MGDMGLESFAGQLSLLSFVLYLILAGLTLINRYRDRVSNAFAALALAMAVSGAGGMYVDGAATLEEFARRINVSFITFSLIPLFILNHVLAISGYHERRDERLLGLRLRIWIWLLVSCNLIMLVLLLIPGVMVLGYKLDEVSGYEPIFRPVQLWLMSALVGGIFLLALYMTARALREARKGPRRHFLRLNIIGALMILLGAPVFGVLFPLFELPGEFMVQVSMVTASLIFFHAINRYQLDRFNELNQALEEKVAARTRHLEKAQERLVRTEKLAAAGRLAAGVTHEVNNPMGAILSAVDTMGRSLEKLRERASDRELSRDELDRVLGKTLAGMEGSSDVLHGAWERVQALMASLQGFVGLDASTFQQVDLNRCLDDTIVLMGPDLGDGLEVERRYGELPPVLVSRADLSELLGHLLRNAVQAMGGEGRVILSTTTEDGEVVLEVADSGPGFSGDQLADLFEPRFTSDGPRVKLGVGLATSYRIAEQHGGSLSARNGQEGGAVLTLRLPVIGEFRDQEQETRN